MHPNDDFDVRNFDEKNFFWSKNWFFIFCLEIIVDVFEMHYDTIEDSLDIWKTSHNWCLCIIFGCLLSAKESIHIPKANVLVGKLWRQNSILILIKIILYYNLTVLHLKHIQDDFGSKEEKLNFLINFFLFFSLNFLISKSSFRQLKIEPRLALKQGLKFFTCLNCIL